ncbi:zinc-ribbon domain-containing protein [Bacteroides sp. 51]|uniref:zinc-ribbon domain-containing protein n=1 Tax=Bacteroides sp. 51 TaxID=2302938 RepID=UPI0013D829C5|nr:zinc-ribbon domain-containing protein [Bacteroides sp. 51]NDV83543.1 zinc-ribbon domain-containing protein [Bacteroides sp. 51]
MFILHGTKTLRIKKYIDNRIKCEECGSYTHIFKVYQDYFHIFFIPFVPFGVKRITSQCSKCGFALNGQKKDFYLDQTRTPKYMYSGIILIVSIITAAILLNLHNQKLKKEYIANPMIGDVYLIKGEANNNEYYFMKVKHIIEDSIYLIPNSYIYSRFVTKFNEKEDYFNLYYLMSTSKDHLKELLEEGKIRSVERDYDEDTGFNVEKNIEMEEEAEFI